MEQKQISIHKDMPIAEGLASFPEKARLLSEILIDFGIHCVGCGAATFETLEEGVLGHGFSEEELNNLVIDLKLRLKYQEGTLHNNHVAYTTIVKKNRIEDNKDNAEMLDLIFIYFAH